MAFDIQTLIKLLQELLNQLYPPHQTSTKMAKSLKPAQGCSLEECCCESLKCHAKILDSAVFFHEQVHSCPDSTQEEKDHAECLIHCAAHAMLYAIDIHQHEHSDEPAESAAPTDKPATDGSKEDTPPQVGGA